ncbi:MAG TPA: thiamine-phosphate kinase [Burkholderiales bacterium]|nr:thiamine-phosphate kinase [Burkholderiales bacterium]
MPPSEFEIIRRYFERPAPNALLGVGDDAALVRVAEGMELAISTDLLVEGRHFLPGADARRLGHKALAVNLSDMAAMGASPRWATLALALPDAEEAWIRDFAEGFFALASRFGVELIGGDTTRGPRSLCVCILGEVRAGAALRRSGAQAGDDVWVSGQLGGAALALAHPELTEAAIRLHAPEPRVGLGERLLGHATAAIDVSDGFAQDLGHILERSHCGALVHYEQLPKCPAFAQVADPGLERRCVLAGGDDYELVFTAAPASRAAIEGFAKPLGVAVTRVGTIRSGDALAIVDREGHPIAVPRGYDHFAA